MTHSCKCMWFLADDTWGRGGLANYLLPSSNHFFFVLTFVTILVFSIFFRK